MKLVCWMCLGVFGAASPMLAAAEDTHPGVPTNFEILERVSSQAADELATSMASIPSRSIMLLSRTKGAGDADFLLENALVRRMTAAGIRITLEEPKDAGSAADSLGYRFSYHVVRLKIAYPKIARRWLLGSKNVARSAQADVAARLIDRKTGEVVWVGESHTGYDDTIGYGTLASVEDAQYEFTRPARDETRLSKLLEPIAVSGIVIGLVYLFFSNQGSD